MPVFACMTYAIYLLSSPVTSRSEERRKVPSTHLAIIGIDSIRSEYQEPKKGSRQGKEDRVGVNIFEARVISEYNLNRK